MTNRILICTLMLFLGACGGGGGGSSAPAPAGTADVAQSQPPSTPDPEPDAPNEPPVAPDIEVQLEDWEVLEGFLPGSDPDGDALSFDIMATSIPVALTDSATGAYRYRPLANTRSGRVEYRVTDEHGAVDYGIVTFLHALNPVVMPGECPVRQADFGEPVAGVWTHPDDSLLFVGFGAERVGHMRRFQLIASGDPVIGPTLEETEPGSARLGEVQELLVDPDDLDTLYARIGSQDVAVSRDLGVTWQYLSEPGYGLEIDDLAVTGGPDGYLWAVNGTGVYRAAKSDLRFRPVLRFAEPTGDRSMAAHPDRPTRLIVANGDGTYLTEDAGESWRLIPQAPAGWLVSDPHEPDRLYANAIHSVYLSADFGQTWFLTGYHGMPSDLLATDPVRRGRLYIAPFETFLGLRVSDDEGGSFEPVDDLPEQVRGIAFTSTGAMYVTQGTRLECRTLFELPEFDPQSPLAVEVEIQDPNSGEPVAEAPVLTPLTARVRVHNRAGRDLDQVEIAVWLSSADGSRKIFGEPAMTVPAGGIQFTLDLPSFALAFRHRLLVTADLPDTAPSGAMAWVATTRAAPEQTDPVEYAVVTHNTLYLNYAHPWFPVVTEPGEQRRMVLDVENQGPDTARNLVVQIATGSALSIDAYGPVRLGQTLDCSEDPDRLTCRLGDMAAGTVQSIELYVTPHIMLPGVPVRVTSDTPSFGPLTGGLDVAPSIAAPAEFVPGEVVEYTVTVTNLGDEVAAGYSVDGAIGPWPAVGDASLQLLEGERCTLERQHDSLTYRCNGDFLHPGETRSLSILITAPVLPVALHHVVSASGQPSSTSSFWAENFTGNNFSGAVSTPAR